MVVGFHGRTQVAEIAIVATSVRLSAGLKTWSQAGNSRQFPLELSGRGHAASTRPDPLRRIFPQITERACTDLQDR